MYRRYIIVGIVFFVLIGAYFIFFDKKDNTKEIYEKYYNKLVNNEEFKSYLVDVNISVNEIKNSDNNYTYVITFDGVTSTKKNIKVLVLNELCSRDNIEIFPSIGIASKEKISLVKKGDEDKENNLYEGVNLSVYNKEKIDCFIIYFSNDGVEEFAKIKVSDYLR